MAIDSSSSRGGITIRTSAFCVQLQNHYANCKHCTPPISLQDFHICHNKCVSTTPRSICQRRRRSRSRNRELCKSIFKCKSTRTHSLCVNNKQFHRDLRRRRRNEERWSSIRTHLDLCNTERVYRERRRRVCGQTILLQSRLLLLLSGHA